MKRGLMMTRENVPDLRIEPRAEIAEISGCRNIVRLTRTGILYIQFAGITSTGLASLQDLKYRSVQENYFVLRPSTKYIQIHQRLIII